jgi:hypothetical protein
MDEMIGIEATGDQQLVELARLLRPATAGDFTTGHPPAPPSQRHRRLVTIPIRASDAAAAGGVEIVHRVTAAVASPDDPAIHAKAADVIAALASLKPRTPMESSLAGLFVAMSAAALDSLAVARIAGFDSVLGVTLLSRAEKLTVRATELAQVIERRGKKTLSPRNGFGKILLDHIRDA